jgi:hypothetical protein
VSQPESIDSHTRTTGRDAVSQSARPFRGRRLSWKEFEALTGRKPPAAANDNEKQEQAA